MATNHRPLPTRIFIDTSVLFAASHSLSGSARDLLVAGILGQVTLVLSRYVVDETRRNLSRKSSQAVPYFEAFLTRGVVEFVEPPPELVHQAATVVVPKDAEILAGAAHGEATFVATYDRKDLLSKRDEIFEAFGVTVATPSEILASL